MDRRYHRSSLLLLLFIISLMAQGCNFARITLNTPLTAQDVAFIMPGQTSLPDVINKLGSPDSLADSTGGVVLTYRFLDLRYSRVNFGWLVKPWSPVDPDLIMSRTGLGTDALQVICDTKGVVTQYAFLRHVTDLPFHPYPF
jgi:hypothetical protein